MPGTFTIQSETLNNSYSHGTDFCDIIPDEQIEWKTDKRGTVIFDGLCVRLKRSTKQNLTHVSQIQINQNNLLN